MVPSSCLHPIRIYNKTLRQYIMVPCGHCEACNVIKGYRRAEKVNAAFNEFHYRYFVTLTYRDECLPLARLDEEHGLLSSNDCDYNGECYTVTVTNKSYIASESFISSSFSKYGGVPVLSHSDSINFKKRLRKELYGKLGEYPFIWLYSVGEYGPLHFRPHLHLCIGFNDRRIVPIFRQCVYSAWQMRNKYSSFDDLRLIGKIDIQPVVGKGCANYCASYLNCTTCLPAVLSDTLFRPFSSSSAYADFTLSRSGDSDVRDVFARCSITQTYVDSETGKECTSLCSQLYKDRYFPRIANFSLFNHDERVTLYRVFEKFCSFTAQEFAQHIIDGKRFGRPFHSSLSVFCCNVYNLIDRYFVSNFEARSRKEYIPDDFGAIVKLKRLYYVSKRVYLNSCACGVSVSEYVSKIEEFYQKIEYDKLKRFYTTIEDLQNDVYNPVSLDKLFHLYFNTSPKISCFSYYQRQFGVDNTKEFDTKEIPHQVQYEFKMRKISLDNTKTKKRNDHFNHRGVSRLPYYFIPTKNKEKFLNNFVNL